MYVCVEVGGAVWGKGYVLVAKTFYPSAQLTILSMHFNSFKRSCGGND